MRNVQEITFEGVCDCSAIVEGTQKLFKKSFLPLEMRLLNKIEFLFFRRFFYQILPNKHRIFSLRSKDYLEKELKTWRLWKDSGILCLELEGIENNKILWKYLENSLSLSKYLTMKKDTLQFENFLDLYFSIRNLAKKKYDSDYFHSDPHLGNFLVLDDKKIIPIDAGVLLNQKMNFSDIDFHLLNHTLLSIVNLNCSEGDKRDYVSLFKEMLTPKEIESFLNYNYQVSNLPRFYFGFREIFASKIKNRERRNPFEIQDKFNWAFNNYIKDIFMK